MSLSSFVGKHRLTSLRTSFRSLAFPTTIPRSHLATVLHTPPNVHDDPPSSPPLPLSTSDIISASFSATTSVSSLLPSHPSYRVKPIPESPIPATISLASGTKFSGHCYGAPLSLSGEVVFTTALVGYPESLTDPSYSGQILVLTQPLIGNYGVPAPAFQQGLSKYYESAKIHPRAIVCQNYTWQFSHRDAIMSLGAWCANHGVPLLSGIDTRELVRILRSSGSTMGAIHIEQGGPSIPVPLSSSANLGSDLVPSVSTRTPIMFGKGNKYKVAVLDFGIKHNILRQLLMANHGNTEVTLFPWNYPIHQYIHNYHGLVLSNGPGDPSHMSIPVSHVRSVLASQINRPDSHKLPIFGICMGNQVLGMAAGLNTYKLKYGNRSHNQPCLDLIHGGCVITSQNHGYALDDSAMPDNWKPFYRNANDGSNEGIWSASGKWRAVQFHPEAWGGPTDTVHLFDSFAKDVQLYSDLVDDVSSSHSEILHYPSKDNVIAPTLVA